jgi:hypothetical protein
MEDGIAGCEQVVRDDSPMTPPPNCFGAHNRWDAPAAEFLKPSKSGPIALGQSVIGIVAEASVLPVACSGMVRPDAACLEVRQAPQCAHTRSDTPPSSREGYLDRIAGLSLSGALSGHPRSTEHQPHAGGRRTLGSCGSNVRSCRSDLSLALDASRTIPSPLPFAAPAYGVSLSLPHEVDLFDSAPAYRLSLTLASRL